MCFIDKTKLNQLSHPTVFGMGPKENPNKIIELVEISKTVLVDRFRETDGKFIFQRLY
ncbi:hypothetical protein LEP1GSC041_2613 [Leptospira noguchii str. 2006001870]|nr:hypothetical protein LEP1GSC041_2613 [Leptospira noguchii str. 2006001870]